MLINPLTHHKFAHLSLSLSKTIPRWSKFSLTFLVSLTNPHCHSMAVMHSLFLFPTFTISLESLPPRSKHIYGQNYTVSFYYHHSPLLVVAPKFMPFHILDSSLSLSLSLSLSQVNLSRYWKVNIVGTKFINSTSEKYCEFK